MVLAELLPEVFAKLVDDLRGGAGGRGGREEAGIGTEGEGIGGEVGRRGRGRWESAMGRWKEEREGDEGMGGACCVGRCRRRRMLSDGRWGKRDGCEGPGREGGSEEDRLDLEGS